MTVGVIEAARLQGQKIILGAAVLLAAVAPLIALLRSLPVLPYAALGAGLVVFALVAARGGGQIARLSVATALMGAVMLITASLNGHPWQLDSHMLYFAALAGIVVLVDIRALLLGAGLVAVQHVGLSVFVPSLIYPAADLVTNLERAAFHGGVLIAEAVALVYTVSLRQKQVQQAEADQDRVAQALAEANKAKAIADEAQAAQAEVVTTLRGTLMRLAERDLSGRIEVAFPGEYDQLRTDFNTAITQLSETIAEVAERAVDLANGASEITAATNDLSGRTESQAATLEETAAALDEITSSVKSAAEGAAKVETYVSETRGRARASGDLVGSAVSAMSSIEKQAEEIQNIIGVIDDIAFQTNLLSLNAGVEAARAGEAGKGFAVVATEVRALAQRSSDAAKDIKTKISGSSKQVDEGVEMVNQVGTALKDIIERVDEISTFVSEIARSSAEQAQGLNEINTGVVSLDQVTQQNAAMVEQCTAAADSLGAHARELRQSMQRFKLAGDGADGGKAAEDKGSVVAFAPAEPGASEPEAPRSFAAAANGDARVFQDF
jgi:methyl-accepting chemotaxis protein